jgi:imidazolonepropionase-like amidohydrolase
MRGWIMVAGALALAPVAGPAAAQDVPGAPSLALANANVVDVRTGAIARGVTVTIVSGRIASVAPGPAPAGTRTIDLKGRYLVPGLIDAHTHLQSTRQARTALESGVTTVRSASVGSFRDVALRDLVRRGALPGPDMVPAGIFVSPRFGEDDILADPELADLRPGPDTAEKARALVRINLKHGVGVIKTRGTERAGLPDTDPRQQSYTEDVLRAIVEEAATRNVPVEAHAHGDEGAMAAVRAGVRSIEHGTYLSDETLKLMKEKGTFLVPTYSTVVDLVEPGGDYDHPALHLRGRHMLPRLADTIRRAHRLGVRLVTGADTSYGPQSVTRISHEVAAFVQLGLSPLEALQSATITAAELLGLEKTTGAIEAGLEADLVAVDGNPLENVVLLQDPLLVVSNGFVVVDRLEFGKK